MSNSAKLKWKNNLVSPKQIQNLFQKGKKAYIIHPRGMLGKKHSKEWINKYGVQNYSTGQFDFKKGQKAWNTGLHIRLRNNYMPHSEESKLKMSLTKKGKHYSRATEFKGVIGPQSPHWKGGITPINMKIRGSDKYTNWRNQVFKRDNYECCCCLNKGYLHAHHIIPFSQDKSQVFDIRNGITLCKSCHFDKGLNLHNLGGKNVSLAN